MKYKQQDYFTGRKTQQAHFICLMNDSLAQETNFMFTKGLREIILLLLNRGHYNYCSEKYTSICVHHSASFRIPLECIILQTQTHFLSHRLFHMFSSLLFS